MLNLFSFRAMRNRGVEIYMGSTLDEMGVKISETNDSLEEHEVTIGK